ncbi:hypothetical protein QF001_006808 [Paraburkholderia youngii]
MTGAVISVDVGKTACIPYVWGLSSDKPAGKA